MDRDMTVMGRADKILASQTDWRYVDAHSNRLGGIELAKLDRHLAIVCGLSACYAALRRRRRCLSLRSMASRHIPSIPR